VERYDIEIPSLLVYGGTIWHKSMDVYILSIVITFSLSLILPVLLAAAQHMSLTDPQKKDAYFATVFTEQSRAELSRAGPSQIG
jgi:hypothetical protein